MTIHFSDVWQFLLLFGGIAGFLSILLFVHLLRREKDADKANEQEQEEEEDEVTVEEFIRMIAAQRKMRDKK